MYSTFVVTLLTLADLAGVLANAFLGGLAARRARLDLVGFVTVAVVCGLGGGMLRDMLLGQGPAVVLTNPAYLVIACAGAVLAYAVSIWGRWTMRLIAVLDAISVGCWSAVGVQKGLAAELTWVPAILLGMVTAVGGGMVRDLLLMKRPAVLGGNTLYATGAFASCLVTLGISLTGHPVLATVASIGVGGGIVLAARRYRWILPTVGDHA